MASRNQRSWETATIVDGDAARARSSTSSVSKSRWLVGSSSSSRSASEATIAAIAARARWPGLSRSIGRWTASASRPKWASRVRPRDSSTPGPAWRRNHGSSGPVAARSCGRCGSRRTLVVTSTSPAVGCSVPRSRLRSVVLPAPLAPETATRSPPWSVRSTFSSTRAPAPRRAATRRPLSAAASRRSRGGAASRGSSTPRVELALQAVLARLRLLRDLLGVALLLVGAQAARAALAAAGVVVGVGDVGLEAPAPLVLRLDELLEPGAAARALGAVGGVAALVGLEGAAGGELVDAVDDGVEEAAVVRDHEQRAVEAGEELLQPREAVGVEVVGRLVEEQHLRVLEQRRRQQRARLLAAREAVQRPVARQVLDPEPAPDLLGAGLGGPRLRRLGAFERVGVAVEVVAAFERAQGGERRARLAERVAEQRVERRLARGRLLREVADAAVARRPRRGRGARGRPAGAAASTCRRRWGRRGRRARRRRGSATARRTGARRHSFSSGRVLVAR